MHKYLFVVCFYFSLHIVFGRLHLREKTLSRLTRWDIPPNPLDYLIDSAKTAYRGATRSNPTRPPLSTLELDKCKCADKSFCKPYRSHSTARRVWTGMKEPFLAAMRVRFGRHVAALWRLYMERSYGDPMPSLIFNDPDHPVTESFINSKATQSQIYHILMEASVRLKLYCLPVPIPEDSTIRLRISDLGVELNRKLMEFGEPGSIAGNIAGGVGSCEFGEDRRDVSGYIFFYTGHDYGSTDPQTKIYDSFIVHRLSFTIKDCIDFCPGQCGTSVEQVLTIPLSRLEATGWAYDVPFTVYFQAPKRKFDIPYMPRTALLTQCSDTQGRKTQLEDYEIFPGKPPSAFMPSGDEPSLPLDIGGR